MSKTDIIIKTNVDVTKIKEVRIVPRIKSYYIDVAFEVITEEQKKSDVSMGVDLGINNLCAITTINNEKICKHDEYLGKRIKRGLFKTKEEYLINADINGAFNILRKATPNFNLNNSKNGAEGIAVSPLKATL